MAAASARGYSATNTIACCPVTHDEVVAEIMARAAARRIFTHYCGPATRCKGIPGVPDLMLAGDRHAGWIEVKVPPDTLSPGQSRWRWKLKASGQLYEAMGPADLAEGGAVDKFLEFLATGRMP